MGILQVIQNLFKPAVDLVDELHTSKEEKAEARAAIYDAQLQVVERTLDYEARLAEAKSKIIIAEAQGHSWMQRNWRPMIMLSFGFTVVYNIVIQPLLHWFLLWQAPEVPPMPLLDIPGWIGAAITTGIGGYIVGRSGEKIASTLTNGGMNEALFNRKPKQ